MQISAPLSVTKWRKTHGARMFETCSPRLSLVTVTRIGTWRGILFEWFRSGRLVGELSVLLKRRHPEVQAEIDRVYQEYLAKLGKRRRGPAAQ